MFKGGDLARLKLEYPADGCLLGLPRTEIAAQTMARISVGPQILYKPRHLLLPRSYPTLELVGLQIGNCHQSASADSIPMDVFQSLPPLEAMLKELERREVDARLIAELVERLKIARNNLGRVDTCNVGQYITLHVHNTGAAPVVFEAALVGSAVPEVLREPVT